MTIYKFLLGLSCVFLISIGQILFKLASRNMSFESIGNWISGIFGNFFLISGLILYFFTTILWISLLRVTDLKVAYPIMALVFIIVPVLAKFFLDEKVGTNTFIGGVFILIGIAISVR